MQRRTVQRKKTQGEQGNIAVLYWSMMRKMSEEGPFYRKIKENQDGEEFELGN